MALDRKRAVKWLRRCTICLVVLTVILFLLGLDKTRAQTYPRQEATSA